MPTFLGAGFDMLGTESGSTEFSHAECSTMLAWINHTAQATAARGKRAFIKCHCSPAGTCPEYDDLDFNFLPQYADTSMGILPHTVQTFALDDPSGGTYGQDNFTYMYDWMVEVAASQPERGNVFYGETAYWVNFDINVPLFLPLYGDRRIHDLRMMRGAEEENVAVSFDGQMNFCSGWEWGYWLQDVMTSRAAWGVVSPAEGSHEDAVRDALKPIIATLVPKSSMVANTLATSVEDWLVGYMNTQNELLIHGLSKNGSNYKTNGHAYMAGKDSTFEVESIVNVETQPPLLMLRRMMHADGDRDVNYENDVQPLLKEMAERFALASVELEALAATAKAGLRLGEAETKLWDELCDATKMTSLRAIQVYAVYEAANTFRTLGKLVPALDAKYELHLKEAETAINGATAIVARREAAYRVDSARTGGWRWTPTSYR